MSSTGCSGDGRTSVRTLALCSTFSCGATIFPAVLVRRACLSDCRGTYSGGVAGGAVGSGAGGGDSGIRSGGGSFLILAEETAADLVWQRRIRLSRLFCRTRGVDTNLAISNSGTSGWIGLRPEVDTPGYMFQE